MPRFAPVPRAAASEKVAQTYGRIAEMFGAEELPEPFLVYGHVPAFLQDFYMNFKKFVWTEGALDVKTKTSVALAVACHGRSPAWIDLLSKRAVELGAGATHAADVAAVAATCAMYNAFFKFRDISGSDLYGGMPVGLRAHTFANTSLDERTVELINVAISDLNGCKPCTAGHVGKSRDLGVSDEAILETIQCAATIAAGTAFLQTALA